MKTTTLLILLYTSITLGQNLTTASEYIQTDVSDKTITEKISTPKNTSNNQLENITLFTTREEYLTNCANGEFLTFEDFAGFSGGPGDSIEACSPVVDSSGDNCFAAGEIQEGVSFTTSAGNIVFFNEGSFGLEDPGVGADTFSSFTIINFTAETPVTSVGFDLYSPLGDGGPIEARIFGETGLIEATTFDVGTTAFFVGIVAEESIVSIELENPAGVIVELVTQFYFGNCETLSVEDTTFDTFSFFPNPAQNELILTSKIAIENVSIFNLLGQKVSTHKMNTTTSTVDISNLTTGAYIMQVISNGQTNTFKFIKK